MTNLHQHMT